MEEEVIEGHRNLLDNFPKWHQTIATLMELPEQIDFDLESKLMSSLFIKLIKVPVKVLNLTQFIFLLQFTSPRCLMCWQTLEITFIRLKLSFLKLEKNYKQKKKTNDPRSIIAILGDWLTVVINISN
jgi:hypothetical protein